MDCPRCHLPVKAEDAGICNHCGAKLEPAQLAVPTRPVSDYNRSPVKRGVRQGLLIIVFAFLLGALIQVFTNKLQLPRYSGDAVAVLGLIAGIARALKIAVFSKSL